MSTSNGVNPGVIPCVVAEAPLTEDWKLVGLMVLGLCIWAATDIQRRGRVDPENRFAHKTDFTVHTEAGAAFFDGRDPYRVTNPRG